MRAHHTDLERLCLGSVWERTEETGQYYMHMYAKEQPDLNWENPEVREGAPVEKMNGNYHLTDIVSTIAMYDVAKFWLDRGCAGFRVSIVLDGETSRCWMMERKGSLARRCVSPESSTWPSGCSHHETGGALSTTRQARQTRATSARVFQRAP